MDLIHRVQKLYVANNNFESKKYLAYSDNSKSSLNRTPCLWVFKSHTAAVFATNGHIKERNVHPFTILYHHPPTMLAAGFCSSQLARRARAASSVDPRLCATRLANFAGFVGERGLASADGIDCYETSVMIMKREE